MSILRSANPQKLKAHRLLDEVKAGIKHPESEILWAFLILGDWGGR